MASLHVPKVVTKTLDTMKDVGDMVDYLIFSHDDTPPVHESFGKLSPFLCVDLEGVNLCREGSVSILTLL
jgi:hypothetical protein